MLIPFSILVEKLNINTNNLGILHVGAHECEELTAYEEAGVPRQRIIWIEALEDKVKWSKNKYPGIQIIQSVVSDQDNQKTTFHVTNNWQSSSLLELEKHKEHHPNIHQTREFEVTTKRLDTLFTEQGWDIKNYQFLNLDLQGAELMALKGLGSMLKEVQYIYSEVNTAYLYKNCALLPEMDQYLQSFGFQRVATRMTRFEWGDAFYIKR